MQHVKGTGTRIKGQGSKWIRPEKRQAIYNRDGRRCVYCQEHIDEVGGTLEHVLPVALGGTNDQTNVVTACGNCNSSKGKLTLRAFLRRLKRCGVDTSKVAIRIRRCTRRPLVK